MDYHHTLLRIEKDLFVALAAIHGVAAWDNFIVSPPHEGSDGRERYVVRHDNCRQVQDLFQKVWDSANS